MSSNGQESAVLNGSYNYIGLSSPDETPSERRFIDPIERVPNGRRLLRVLIADDYKDAADTMAALVKVWGHEVRVAYDGAAALKLALVYKPDVLLLDIAMPLIDGYRLARLVREQPWNQDTVMIAVTGYADAAHHLLGLEAGFHHYLAKPVKPAILKNLLLQVRHKQEILPEVPTFIEESYDFLFLDKVADACGVLV